LIENHQLGPKLLDVMNRHLARHGVDIRGGTIVDATVIHAPTSTKNEAKSRDPEMQSKSLGS